MTETVAGQSSIDLLSKKLNKEWPHIRAARVAAIAKREQIKTVLEATRHKLVSSDASVVVFGSLAREEWTQESDLDWGYLLDGQADPQHLNVAQSIASTFEREKLGELPGPTGIFGNPIFSHELVHWIGGENDTNSNMTRRLLLLLESRPIGVRDAYDRVIRVILERYFDRDADLFSPDKTHFRVPRFLLNDIVRYWRTIAVDFASKQRERAGAGWGLRNVKLRMSRKLIFSSGLLVCFSCQSKPSPAVRDVPEKCADVLIEHVSSYMNKTPLEILADALLRYSISDKTVCNLLDSYDIFLECLNDVNRRGALKKLSFEASKDDKVFQQMRDVGHTFQAGLDKFFFHENEELCQLIQKYGVF
ncbi:MAG: nucleotidyltransferase domain-containing protein [Acidobacteriia bacterium]|nr:nucleotidyltransferase domain-containing protein [Terriglobia bacterium]